MEYPKISIITPTFNRIEFLEECIVSVISQRYPNLEYIICDGGSKNEQLFNLFDKYSAFITSWDSIPDNGHAEAIRRGIDKSTGEIIGYLCSDDLLVDGALFKLAEYFNKNPKGDVFYGNTYTLGNSGNVVSEKRCFPFNKYSLFTSLPWSQPSLFWTKSAYVKAGKNFGGANFEFNIYEPNVDIVSRFQKSNCFFVFVPHFLSYDRRHDGTVTYVQNNKVRDISIKIIRRHHPFLANKYIYPLFKIVMQGYALIQYLKLQEFSYIITKIKTKTKSGEK